MVLQLPGEIDIHFSIGGKTYLGEPIVFKPVEDRIFEQSRNVTIKLHHRVGRFVKVRLHFAHRWILVSEFTFRSGKSFPFQLFSARTRNLT